MDIHMGHHQNLQKGGGDCYSESQHRSSLSTTSSWSSDDPVPHHDWNFDANRGCFSGEPNRHYQHEKIGIDGDGGAGDYCSNVFSSGSVRKRQFPDSGRGAPPPGYGGGRNYVKLYVAGIPRTSKEEEIRSLFELYGSIVEIVLLKDTRTGQQRECCFVKYTTSEEADRAIGVLNNKYIFPGGVLPIKVRYADGERDRLRNLGEQAFKLYVNGLNKQASKREIIDIFSAYGLVEDIYIVCDELKQSRGCGFIKYAHRDMAIAAKDALNGTYVMRGCDQPLVVRFADPKKPRVGEPRNNSSFGSSCMNQRSRESVVSRPVPYVNDQMAGKVQQNLSHPFSPKTTQSSSQSLQFGGKSVTVCGTSTASGLVDPVECDWSEHTCPDGYKYYYNCVSFESRWDKPEEYSAFEQKLMKQQEHQQQQQHQSSRCKESSSPLASQVLSTEEVPQMQPQDPIQTESSHPELRQAPSSSPELDGVQVVPAHSPIVQSTCG